MVDWHRFHVLVQILQVLCVIGDVAPVSEVPSWETTSVTNFHVAFNASDTEVESSTTRQDEIMGNFQDKSVIEENTFLSSITDDPSYFTTSNPEVPWTTEIFEVNSRQNIDEPKKEADESVLVESRSLDLIEIDFDNVIDTSGDDESDSKESDHRTTTEEPELPMCEDVEIFTLVTQSSKSFIDAGQQSKDGEIIVEDLTIDESKPNALVISWKPPNATAEVKYYIVEWFMKDERINGCRATNETFGYTISSLQPCTTYKVRVTPSLEVFTGAQRVVTGTTGLDVDRDSLNLKIAANGTDWLKISWNMPNIECVSYYLISFCDDDNCTVQTNTTTYNKTDLSPCVTYNFNLTIYGSDGAYGSTNVTGQTAFLNPGPPSPAETIPGNYTLLVIWPEPVGHSCVDHYRITWNRDRKSGTETTKETKISLTGLEACATYDIIIIAVHSRGESLPETITSNRTAPAATDAPLMRLNGTLVTTRTISIDWLIYTNETNNCAPLILIVQCYGVKILGQGYKFVNGSVEYAINSGITNVTPNTTVEELTPFTKYTCLSFTANFGGLSSKSADIPAETLQDVPPAPTLFGQSGSSNVTNTSITFQWKRPGYLPGILKNIMIMVRWTYPIDRPHWCTETAGSESITDIDGAATSYVYKYAKPYAVHRATIRAATGAGWGEFSKIQTFQTEPGAPSEVTNLRLEVTENSEDSNILNTVLSWRIPCLINGRALESFHIIGTGSRDGFEQHNFTQIFNYTKNRCPNDTCAMSISFLREEHTYSIEVAAKVQDYLYLGAVSDVIATYPAGIPPPPDENYTNIITIDPFKARRTTSTATVLLPIFPETGGTIKCYAIIVSKIGYNNETFGRLRSSSDLPNTASWVESMRKNFEIPYQATTFCRDMFPSHFADYGRLKAVKYVLGEDNEPCQKLSSNGDERSYCNGPLNPDTWYHVRIRAFTDGGYRDSIAFTVKTNAELQVAIVVGTIFGILFLGILTTMMLLVRKCSLQAVLRRFLHSDMPGSPVPAPFTRRKFIAHCQQLADNPGKLSNEYQLLQTLSVDLQMPTNAACLQANKKKNRYTDILPYDFSRVKLEVIDNDPNTDYINASFIKGFSGDEDYIACQGPKEETTYDFWRMIDQYNVKIIVMLTQLIEKNKEKCHQYFPTIRETFTYENMAIRCSMELDYRTYTQRTLVLQKENERRNIIHLHFKDWPDHDVPEDFDPMINFCQIMRRHMEANRGLVVIHCSAGIGRTGTLIAIDILLQHIKDNRKLDVFGTVYRLRHHRINMVQRESQYAYIYNCIRQVLKNPYFSKTYKPPSVDPISGSNGQKKKDGGSDSSTNLVSSIETLMKSSLSTSVESAEPIYQTLSMSTSKSRTCYSLNGLRCSKSTGAIDTRPYQQHIDRYNTHDHLISDITNDVLIKNSDISLEITESEGSTTSIYENMQPLSRSKSAHVFEQDEDACVTEKLLDQDTSL